MALPISFTIKITYDEGSSDASYVAYCPELDVSSCGSTVEKAREMLSEAVDILFSSASKEGTLNTYLESVGYHKKGNKYLVPRVSTEQSFFNISDDFINKFTCQV
ncbi:MAG: type II toxin-antitoxin system HicB family antitoxin [bacterium]|nr:type II toxin-antitoxin system HicB family antitoxin [bacterium]